MSATRRRRADGEQTRAAILDAATKLATIEGLDGLSIGRLADHIGMSKSGLYAHFGSKEELQLAAIDTASEIFADAVIRPAREPETAFERLEALCENFFRYLEKPVFPGGCFFASAAAELDTHPGPGQGEARPVARRLAGAARAARSREAQEAGELDPAEDPALLAFELDAFMKMGNSLRLLHGGDSGLRQARRAVTRAARARPRDESSNDSSTTSCRRRRATWHGGECTDSSPRSPLAGILVALLLIWRGTEPGARRALVADPVRTPGVLNPDVRRRRSPHDDLRPGLDADDPPADRRTRTG